MTTSRDLIKSIMDEDFVAAKEITKNLVFAAVADELELARQEVGANLFGCTDCEEMNEGQMSAIATAVERSSTGVSHIHRMLPRRRLTRTTTRMVGLNQQRMKSLVPASMPQSRQET